MLIRRFLPEDGDVVAKMVAVTLREVSSKDYSSEYIEDLISRWPPQYFIDSSLANHFYVLVASDEIVGCGAIGPYRDRADESILLSIFVHPAYQGRGLGRKILETLEADEYFLNSRRIELLASLSAENFYLKMGYTYKNGKRKVNDLLLVEMEKVLEKNKFFICYNI